MKVLFVYSLDDILSIKRALITPEQIQLGISYISSLLKKHGHVTKLLVLSKIMSDNSLTSLVHTVKSFSPRLICFTSVATEYPFIEKAAKLVKEKWDKKIFLLIGGVYASLYPLTVIRGPFDAVCRGEGEYPTLELVNRLESGACLSGIQNIWFKSEDKIEKNELRPFIQDLDTLPFPDRSIWEEWILKRTGDKASILIARGCPFSCTYCSNPVLRDLASGQYVRFRSPRKIIEEIKELSLIYPYLSQVYFEVESFALNMPWALSLCKELESLNRELAHPFTYGVNLRITHKQDYGPIFKACQRSKIRFIKIGVETGDEHLRTNVLKRDYTNSDVLHTVAEAKKYGLKFAFFNLIGIPGETHKHFLKTVALNRKCLPIVTMTSIFHPYPGTELHSICERENIVRGKKNVYGERQNAYLNLPGFNKSLIQKDYDWFDFYVYRGYRPLAKIIYGILLKKLKRSKKLFFLYLLLTKFPTIKSIPRKIKKLLTLNW